MKSKVLIALIGITCGISINHTLAVSNSLERTVSLVDYNLHNAVRSLGALHQIKIGEVSGLESSLEENLNLDVGILASELEGDRLSDEEREQIIAMLVLISVMNEKFEIGSWRQDTELQNSLGKIQAQEPEQVEKFRCKDWSQPMWVGPECA